MFLARLPDVTILDPMDYTIIVEWEKQEIPLSVVLCSINEVCDSLSDERVKIESISYFQEAVRKNFKDWLQIQAQKK